jgi:hypothetical protein
MATALRLFASLRPVRVEKQRKYDENCQITNRQAGIKEATVEQKETGKN